jgi:predicted phage baseplate assembly protein
MVPPVGRDNVRATRYRRGGGVAGNRDAGKITELKSAVPYVQGVTNWAPARGGTPMETVDTVRERGPRGLRHRGRAVAVADFEDLALEASTEVARAWALSSGGGGAPGSVGLVVVPKGAGRQPVPTLDLLTRVEDEVAGRATPTFSLWVAGPGWTEVTVTAEVVPEAFGEAARVEAEVLERLNAFLHPLTGGPAGTGWPFGRRPHRSDIHALIEAVPGVDHVRALAVEERVDRPAPAPGASLVFSGTHSIVMSAGD